MAETVDSGRLRRLGMAILFASPETRIVELAVIADPRQLLHGVLMTGGGEEVPLEVERGHVLAPAGISLPWKFRIEGFEPTVYSAADLAISRPIVMRQLGTVRGKLDRPTPSGVERFTWFVRQRVPPSVTEVRIEVDEEGGFEFHLPAGLYEGSALGESCASKIRSRIMVKPGGVTNLGRIACDSIRGSGGLGAERSR